LILVRHPRGSQLLRTAMLLALIILPFLSVSTVRTYGLSFSLKYDLGYSGVPFAGGEIVVASNFTNLGQLTLRVTSVSFASDFWSNGTRQVTSGFPFNLTAGMNREVETPILIPTSASIGNHNVTSTATWQYSSSSGWVNANPAVTSINVNVSQTLESLFSGFVTILLIGLGVAGVVVVLVVFLVIKQRKKPKPGAPLPASPQPNLNILSWHRHS
jgi:uncharacterized membrane protein